MEYIYKFFEENDILKGAEKQKTYPLWTDNPTDVNTVGESTINTFYTMSSEVTAWEGNYYYNVYSENTASNLNAPVQFSVAFGTSQKIKLYYPTDTTYEQTYPSYAVYRQFANLLLNRPSSETKFYFSGSTTNAIEHAYFISVARDRIKDGIERDTWQLNLSGSTGLLSLVNRTGSDEGALSVDLISGTASGYTGTTPTATYGLQVGLFYPKHGVFVLDANKVHQLAGTGSVFNTASYSGSTVVTMYTSSQPLNNIWELIKDGLYFKARSVESVKSTHYFCNIKNYEFNYSTNPTWVSGSNNEVKDDFYNEKKTFITGVGLCDATNQVVAVTKLSRPLAKDPTIEQNITVRIDF